MTDFEVFLLTFLLFYIDTMMIIEDRLINVFSLHDLIQYLIILI